MLGDPPLTTTGLPRLPLPTPRTGTDISLPTPASTRLLLAETPWCWSPAVFARGLQTEGVDGRVKP